MHELPRRGLLGNSGHKKSRVLDIPGSCSRMPPGIRACCSGWLLRSFSLRRSVIYASVGRPHAIVVRPVIGIVRTVSKTGITLSPCGGCTNHQHRCHKRRRGAEASSFTCPWCRYRENLNDASHRYSLLLPTLPHGGVAYDNRGNLPAHPVLTCTKGPPLPLFTSCREGVFSETHIQDSE